MEEPAKKKMSVLKKVLIALAILVGAAIVTVVVLILVLYGRFAAPGTLLATPTPTVALTPAPVTPDPSASPTPLPTATPEPTPEPTPLPDLPLSDLYEQTYLTDEQLSRMDANLADPRFMHVLLVGIDRRGRSGYAQTDTMLIATLDRKNNRIKLTSLLRDLYFPIEGYGAGRVNSIAAREGMDALIGAINQHLHMNLSNYIMVDFNMFEDIVDILGGVTVKMTAEEISAANDCIAGLNKQRGVSYLWDGFIFADAGNVKLTGKQALGYARIRKIDSDFARTNRQFKVLNAMFAKLRTQSLTKQYEAVYKIAPYVETNLDILEMIDVVAAVSELGIDGMMHYSLPAEGLYQSARVSGSSVLLADLPANAWAMHSFIFDDDSDAVKANVLKPGPSLPPRTPSPASPTPSLDDPNGGWTDADDNGTDPDDMGDDTLVYDPMTDTWIMIPPS